MARRQGVFWMLTIPHEHFTPWLPDGVKWIRGQLECGESTSYLHWQLLVAFDGKVSLARCRGTFGPFNAELSRSDAAAAYVWKESTRVAGTQFELGAKPIRLNARIDWEEVWTAAASGAIQSVPAHIRIRSYFALRAIRSDHQSPAAMDRTAVCYWGVTGSGKSHAAYEEAGDEIYSKDPRTKFWDGYRGQEAVVIDEFRGAIDIAHILRWIDKYPVTVEVKGSSVPLCAKRFWFTSNLHPRTWYPDLDDGTMAALLRRLELKEFSTPFVVV